MLAIFFDIFMQFLGEKLQSSLFSARGQFGKRASKDKWGESMSVFHRYQSDQLENTLHLLNSNGLQFSGQGRPVLPKGDLDPELVASTHWIHALDLPVCVLDEADMPITINAAFFELPIDVTGLRQPLAQLLANNQSFFSSCYHFLLDLNEDNSGPGAALFVISAAEFAAILAMRGIVLTKAEYALLLKFLAGLSLKQSAEQEGSAYETKRDQFKSIMKKLGVNKNFEVAIVIKDAVHARIISKLVETKIQAARLGPDFPGGEMVQKHYSSSVRLLSVDLDDNLNFKLYDVGPAGGRAVVIFHTIFQPLYPLPHALPLLYKHNLRFLVPIRPGYCGVEAGDVGTMETVRHFTRDLDKALDSLGIEDIDVIGILHGGIWASHYMALTSRKVIKALLASPGLPSLGKDPKLSLGSVLGKLIKSQRALLSQVIRWHLFVIRTPEMVQKVTRSVYSKIPPDLDHMEALNAHKFMTPWLSKILDSSVDGIVNDLLLDDLSMLPLLEELGVPTVIQQGSADVHTPAARLEAIIESMNNSYLTYQTVEGEGLLFNLNQPERIIEAFLSMTQDKKLKRV